MIDFFEEYSRKVKEKRFKPQTDHLEDIYVPKARYELARKILPLMKVIAYYFTVFIISIPEDINSIQQVLRQRSLAIFEGDMSTV